MVLARTFVPAPVLVKAEAMPEPPESPDGLRRMVRTQRSGLLSPVASATLTTGVPLARWLRRPVVVSRFDAVERPTVIAQFEGLEHAFRALLAYGPEAEVLAPRELRERIAAAAAETVAVYSGAAS